jgi:hypothetical protein
MDLVAACEDAVVQSIHCHEPGRSRRRQTRSPPKHGNGRGKREMKALLVVSLLLGVGFPMNEATGQTAACRKALAANKSAAEAFLHATVSLGPANLVPTCTALDALLNARKRKDATQKRVRAACPAGTIRTEDTRQWKQLLETEKTRIEECNVGRQRGRNAAAHQATRSRIRPRSVLESKMITGAWRSKARRLHSRRLPRKPCELGTSHAWEDNSCSGR